MAYHFLPCQHFYIWQVVTVAIELIEEVLDNAPPTIKGGELVLLVVLAEQANGKTREARQSAQWTLETVMHRARLAKRGLQDALLRLAAKGCEVRKPLRFKADGEPVYAYSGKSMTFRLPRFSNGKIIENLNYPEGHPLRIEIPGKGTAERTLFNPEGTPQRTLGHATADPFPQKGSATADPISSKNFPSKIPSSLSAPSVGTNADVLDLGRERDRRSSRKTDPVPQRLLAALGATPEEIAVLVPSLTGKYNIGGDGWWISADRNGTLADRLAEHRAPVQLSIDTGAVDEMAAFLEGLKSAPDCVHGSPGGAMIRPDTRKPQCPMCRKGLPGTQTA